MTPPICAVCGITPCPDSAYLCQSCTGKLRSALRRIADLVDELEVTVVRQSRLGGSNGGSRSAETLLPFAFNPSLLPDTLRNSMTTWARHIAEELDIAVMLVPRERPSGPLCSTPRSECRHQSCLQIGFVQSELGQLADWLVTQVPWMRRRPEVPQMFDELVYDAGELERMIDRPAERWYAGPCDAVAMLSPEQRVQLAISGRQVPRCAEELYVPVGAVSMTCRKCGTLHEVATRRKTLLRKAEDQLAHAELIGRALMQLGEPVTSSQIRNWGARGRLLSRGEDFTGRRLYRVGDVIELARQTAQKKRKAAS